MKEKKEKLDDYLNDDLIVDNPETPTPSRQVSKSPQANPVGSSGGNNVTLPAVLSTLGAVAVAVLAILMYKRYKKKRENRSNIESQQTTTGTVADARVPLAATTRQTTLEMGNMGTPSNKKNKKEPTNRLKKNASTRNVLTPSL